MAAYALQSLRLVAPSFLLMFLLAPPLSAQESLQDSLIGTWRLVSYTYQSNGRVYTTPDAMDGVANFYENGYDIDILAYIPAGNAKRARRAFESGSYSVEGGDVRLVADKASHAAELGEEILTGVTVDGDEMRFSSHQGDIHEIWERFLQ